MERLRKSTNSLSEYGLSSHLNLYLGPHKHGVQTTQPQHSLKIWHKIMHFTHTPHTHSLKNGRKIHMSAPNEMQLRLATLQGYCSIYSPTHLWNLTNLVLGYWDLFPWD
jgi:hypothetical protein